MILLASGSARRADLLRQIDVPFVVAPVDIDERARDQERPADYVERLAVEKAQAGWQRLASVHNCRVALGADTTVTLGNQMLGKPESQADHLRMMQALGGQTHEVLSAVALTDGQRTESRVVVSRVKLRSLTSAEILRYWQSGEPGDKAGGYAIQGLGAIFVESVQGSYSSVVGLPLLETAQLLDLFGLTYWLTEAAGE